MDLTVIIHQPSPYYILQHLRPMRTKSHTGEYQYNQMHLRKYKSDNFFNHNASLSCIYNYIIQIKSCLCSIQFYFQKKMATNSIKKALLLSLLLVISLQGASNIKCPQGKTLTPKVDYSPTPNGCGGSSTQSKVDEIFNPFSKLLVTCCNDHDTCFSTCDTSGNAAHTFKECNEDFDSCLKNQCKKKKNPVEKSLCKTWAKGYYIAVSQFGGKYYNQDQKAACTCQ